MKAIRIASQVGETVDALVWRALGSRAGVVEAVLDVNPGLAALGPILPPGTLVELPLPVAAAPQSTLLQLWD